MNGQRPLFEPCRLLSSCKAWRWGWWRRQGGKLVFRLPSPPSPKGEVDNIRHGFLCLYQPLIEAAINGLIPQLNPCFLLRVTPSANRNSYRVATPYYIYTYNRKRCSTHATPLIYVIYTALSATINISTPQGQGERSMKYSLLYIPLGRKNNLESCKHYPGTLQ